RKDIKRERVTQTYKANDSASPTPAADDKGVVVFFSDFGLMAYAPDGQAAWSYRLGPFKNFYGMSASPIITGNSVIQLCDPQTGSFIIAVDRTTGKIQWRTERPGADIGWSTPMIYKPAKGPAEVIVL